MGFSWVLFLFNPGQVGDWIQYERDAGVSKILSVACSGEKPVTTAVLSAQVAPLLPVFSFQSWGCACPAPGQCMSGCPPTEGTVLDPLPSNFFIQNPGM